MIKILFTHHCIQYLNQYIPIMGIIEVDEIIGSALVQYDCFLIIFHDIASHRVYTVHLHNQIALHNQNLQMLK